MNLTIISPSIKNEKILDEFLYNLKKQNNQDFEIILVINSTSSDIYKVLDKNISFFGSRLKFVINSKQKSTQSNIVAAFRLISGKYVSILNYDNDYKPNVITNLVNLTNKYSNVDVIEYKPYLSGTIKWKPNKRIESDEIINIQDNPRVLAFSFPLITNKIYKSTLVQQLIKHKSKEVKDEKFCIELTYYLLLKASNYVYSDLKIIKEHIDSGLWLNPKNYISQFKVIHNLIEVNEIKRKHELEYAELYFMHVVLGGILNSNSIRIFSAPSTIFSDKANFQNKRNKKLISDLYTWLTKYHENNSLFFTTNLYLNDVKNVEASILKSLPNQNKWDEIFDKL
ncbi:glycosyltransferase family A protein [Mycoplasma sp. Mirounga ES2805-ORL]|uniref:glycosyltransferase family A protein n=1 Tax=Mycoplasma sp. Mirounga ES2805-ORL TaxID=754514 RepID=UPI00197B0EEC|nr:glycosyltransferase family 2 protein [Mycoplasma sp. Mirounga ES2805-ORL]QSF13872.1 glycosyltransferase family 2 protein [Mycoplasma sp. Mirounga ES2805-ORL]